MESFYRRFVTTASRYPNHIAVELQATQPSSSAGERYTYAELRRIAEHIGGWIQQSGIVAGSRCAILANNSPRWVAAYLGTMAAGCVIVPLDTAFKPEQVAKLLKDSGASLLFVDADHLETAKSAWSDISNVEPAALGRVFVIDSHTSAAGSFDAVLAQPVQPLAPLNTVSDDLAVLLYTSGTTSDPKGVMLTHGNLNAEADAVFQSLQLGPDDAILGVLPLFHALAQMANLLLPLSVGMRVVYLETLNTTELLRGLEERDITVFCCVPQFFYLIHERVMKQAQSRGRAAQMIFRLLLAVCRAGRRVGLNLGKMFFAEVHRRLGKKMRYLITGGSRFDPKIGRDLEDMGFDVLQAYGLTETTGGAFLTRPEDNVLGSVGKPLPGNQVRIQQATDQGEEGTGEILIRGPIVMKGYYNRPDATAEVLKDGWLHTGDLGRVDSRGNLFVTGRSKDVIVLSNGKNIYPEEIEAHYLQSPLIKEICVMGLESRPGEPLAERLHAIIVPNFDVLRERKVVNAREVMRFDVENLSAQLPGTKRILSYDIWPDELPRTTTRKLKRFEIRRRFLEKGSPSPDAAQALTSQRQFSNEDRLWLENAEVQQAISVIRASSKKEGEIHPDDNLELDVGLDSMERVELVVALEGTLGAHVEDSELANVYSVRELVNALLQHRDTSASGPKRSGWEAVFAVETSDEEVKTTLNSSRWTTIFWFVAARLARYLSQALYRIQVSGIEKLPQNRPFIFSPNHQSFIDAPLIMGYFPFRIFRKMFYVGTSEIFGKGIRRRIGRSLRLVPIDPDANLVSAMRAGAYGLRRGEALVLYPEGERSISGEPKTFKKGAAILATHLQVPIVPVAIEGFERAWGRRRGIRLFQKLQIRVGEPIEPPPATNASEKTYDSLTQELRHKVMEMWLDLHGERQVKPELVDTRG
jgi:long-chain acyl-CoA synthetase